MRRTVLLLASMALALLLAGGMAQAIINGEPDTGPSAHPYVGALVSVPPSGQFKGQRVPVCSGTLISARVFLTAGHCTDTLIKEELPTYVSFDPTYKEGASKLISATPHTHPQYDVGVVVLEEPVRMAAYGALPAKAGLVDTLKEGQHLTVVGYGENGFDIGSEPPLHPQPVLLADRSRATVRLLHTKDPDVGDQYVKTTGIGIIGGGEGACRGDSGGPLFLSDQQTIVAVTSRGIAPLCRGPTYYQRMDLPGVLHWVRSFP